MSRNSELPLLCGGNRREGGQLSAGCVGQLFRTDHRSYEWDVHAKDANCSTAHPIDRVEIITDGTAADLAAYNGSSTSERAEVSGLIGRPSVPLAPVGELGA